MWIVVRPARPGAGALVRQLVPAEGRPPCPLCAAPARFRYGWASAHAVRLDARAFCSVACREEAAGRAAADAAPGTG